MPIIGRKQTSMKIEPFLSVVLIDHLHNPSKDVIDIPVYLRDGIVDAIIG
jgi:hypothetical protein